MKKLKNRGPKSGYIFEEKTRYRDDVWRSISEARDNDMENKTVLIFPSNHDEEIKVVLGKGVKEENIYACDESAALLATAKWRKEYPKINILGVSLTRAIEKLHSAKIRIDVANFDFCSNLCESIFIDIATFIKYVASDSFCFGVTILKGREPALETLLAKMLFTDIKGSADRVKILAHFVANKCDIKIKEIVKSEYKSGAQYMSYGVYKTVNTEKVKADVLMVFNKNEQLIKETMALDDAFHDQQYKQWALKKQEKEAGYKKQRDIQNLFFKKRAELKTKIDRETGGVDGWGGGEWFGKNVSVDRHLSKNIDTFMEIESMPNHNIRY